MTTSPSRRQLFVGLGVAAVSSTFVGVADPSVANPSSTKGRPKGGQAFPTDSFQRAVKAMAAAGAVGVVATVVGPSGRYSTAAGTRDPRTGNPARTQDRARIASITKAMTATLVLQEVETGHWTLETTIGDVWPGLYPGRNDVTITQLMNHTSGMPDAIWDILGQRQLWELRPEELRLLIDRHYDEQELVSIAHGMEWLFDPGTGFAYSNTGYVVLSLLLEHQNRRTIKDLIRERILKPAGMQHTRLEDTTIVRGRHLVPVAGMNATPVVLDRINPSIFSGAGGVYATSDDVATFYTALMRGRLLTQELVDVMITPVGAASWYGYGYGVYQMLDPCAGPDPLTVPLLVGHDGAGFGTLSIAAASRDGQRCMAMSWSGRDYGPWAPMPPYSDVLSAAFLSTCTTNGGAPDHSTDRGSGLGTGQLRL